MPFFKNCCWGFTLKTGNLLIGTIALIGNTFLIYSVVLAGSPRYSEAGKIALIVHYSIGIILSIMLIIGTIKGNKWILLVWIIVSAIQIVLDALLILWVSTSTSSSLTHLGSFIGSHVYFLLVAISHYQELNAAEMEEPDDVLPIYLTPNSMSSYVYVVNALPDPPHKEEE